MLSIRKQMFSDERFQQSALPVFFQAFSHHPDQAF
jgi:hypothetical protein